jgi:hypothetical protein
VRLKALLVELDAETQADVAEIRRADARLAEPGVPGAERGDVEESKRAAVRRATDARIRAFETGMAVLTPEQVLELHAVPPHVTGAERAENPREIVKTMALTPAQAAALRDLAASYEDEKRRVEAEVLRVSLAARERGPDSPRQDETMMAYAGVQGRAQEVIRAATREVFLTLLREDQVIGWVLGVPR